MSVLRNDRALFVALALVTGACSEEEASKAPACTSVVAEGSGNPLALAVGGGNVYFSDTENGSVFAAPARGGAPRKLLGGLVHVQSLAADEENVYVADAGSGLVDGVVLKVPSAGGDPTQLAFGQSDPIAIAVRAGTVYVANATAGTVVAVPGSGEDPFELATGHRLVLGVAADDRNVYFTDYGGGTVSAVPIGGGTTRVLAQGEAGPTAVTVDARTAYFTNPVEGTIKAVPLDGGEVDTLTSGRKALGSIALGATHVYFVENAGSGNGIISSVPKKGGAVATVASEQVNPSGIATDGNTLYWTLGRELQGKSQTGAVLKLSTSEMDGTTPAARCEATPPPDVFATERDGDGGCNNCYDLCAETHCETLTTWPGEPYWQFIAADSDAVYWFTGAGAGPVMKLANGRTEQEVVVPFIFPDSLAAGSGWLFWSESWKRTVMSVPTSGGTPQKLAVRPRNPSSLFVDSASVYWIETSLTDGAVVKAPIAGGAPVELVAGPIEPTALWVSGSTVYFTDARAGAVLSVPTAGGTPTTLATTTALLTGVTTDGTNVYWTSNGRPGRMPREAGGRGDLGRVPMGGGAPILLAHPGNAKTPLVLGSVVYYLDDDPKLLAAPVGGGVIRRGPERVALAAQGADSIVVGKQDGTIIRITAK